MHEPIDAKAEETRILKLGGVIFDDYVQADEAEMAENYPDHDYQGIYPLPKGRFLGDRHHGLRLYIPHLKEWSWEKAS